MPRDDLASNGDWLVLGVGEIGAVDGNGLALILIGPSGVIAVAGDGERQVRGAGDMIGLAVVERLELRKFVGIFLNEVRQLVHQIAALRGGELLAPSPGLEGSAGGADRLVDVGSVGFRYLGDDFAG